MDVTKRSQISLVIRFIDKITIKEDFVIFVDAFDETRLIRLSINNNKLNDTQEKNNDNEYRKKSRRNFGN